MDLQLAGKNAAVMASSAGLGRAAAEALAGEGANVLLCGRQAERLQASVAQIQDAHPDVSVEGLVADVERPDDVRRFIDRAVARGNGKLDVLVTNSGGPEPGRFETLTDDHWRHAFNLLALAPVRAVRRALPALQAARGSAIAIVSTSVKQPIPELVLSNSVRMAVVGLWKTLATQYAPHGVRFNCVLPGSFQTDRILELVAHQAAAAGVPVSEAKANKARETPLGRLGHPRELAHAIAFLASPRASYVTGQTWAVDGGLLRGTYG
jgi:3-oxoacyl-[acyl-carrier protein] reductase